MRSESLLPHNAGNLCVIVRINVDVNCHASRKEDTMSDLIKLFDYVMELMESVVGDDEIATAERKSLNTLANAIAREIEEVYA